MPGSRALFDDRIDAGRQLADALLPYRAPVTAVLGVPRGGVPVAAQVADALGAPLDVLIVRKLGSPRHPEYALGAIGEGGTRTVDPEAIRLTGVSESALREVERMERVELTRRAQLYRSGSERLPLAGARAIVVDDGLATGATASVACRIARGLGAAEVVLAVPVAPSGWERTLAGEADAFVAVATPDDFWAVGRWYRSFEQTTDTEVIGFLARRDA
jgi:putative phosphoribosyl transferase